MSLGYGVGKNVLVGKGAGSQKRERTQPNELRDGSHTTNDHVRLYDNVTGELRQVCQDDVIADLAIMTYVSVRHDEHAVPYTGDPSALLATEVQRGAFPDSVVVADDELGVAAFVGPVLRRPAQSRAALDEVVRPHHHFTMGTAKSNVWFHYGVWADLDPARDDHVRPNLCLWRDGRFC